MIDVKSIEILYSSTCSLKETSKSDHDGGNDSYMTNSELNVVGFDLVKEKYIKTLSVPEIPKSSDALFYVNNSGEMYLIEFKSGKMDQKEIFDVRLKIFDSLLMLTDILNKGISYTRHNLCFLLVYDETKNPSSRTEIGKHYLRKARKKYIRFDLERFKKLYFKDVFTVTKDDFENDFVKKWESAVN